MSNKKYMPKAMLAIFVATAGYGISFPLLALSLEKMAVSESLIGLNAAMPALGWIIASILIPRLHTRHGTLTLMLFFLAIAAAGLIGFASHQDYSFWLVCRLLFGGGMGMFFRTFEFYLNSEALTKKRGQVLGLYLTAFLGGIIFGSALQPLFGTGTVLAYIVILICLLITTLLLLQLNVPNSPDTNIPSSLITLSGVSNLFRVLPLAAVGALTYGLIESIPAYLMPIYALRIGFDTTGAAYTLTAFALGNIVFAYPLGLISDKIGRFKLLVGCVIVTTLCMSLLPLFAENIYYFLGSLVLVGGCVVGLYSSSLAIIGDHFTRSKLIYANACFGIIYAGGSLVGPIVHGTSMQIIEPHGMIISSVFILLLFLLFTSKLKYTPISKISIN